MFGAPSAIEVKGGKATLLKDETHEAIVAARSKSTPLCNVYCMLTLVFSLYCVLLKKVSRYWLKVSYLMNFG